MNEWMNEWMNIYWVYDFIEMVSQIWIDLHLKPLCSDFKFTWLRYTAKTWAIKGQLYGWMAILSIAFRQTRINSN